MKKEKIIWTFDMKEDMFLIGDSGSMKGCIIQPPEDSNLWLDLNSHVSYSEGDNHKELDRFIGRKVKITMETVD